MTTQTQEIGLDKFIPLTFGVTYEEFLGGRILFSDRDEAYGLSAGRDRGRSGMHDVYKFTGDFTLDFEQTRKSLDTWVALVFMTNSLRSTIRRNFWRKPHAVDDRILVYAKVEKQEANHDISALTDVGTIAPDFSNVNGRFYTELIDDVVHYRYVANHTKYRKGWKIIGQFPTLESLKEKLAEQLPVSEEEVEDVTDEYAGILLYVNTQGNISCTPIDQNTDGSSLESSKKFYCLVSRSLGISAKANRILKESYIVLIKSAKATAGYKFVSILPPATDTQAYLQENPEYTIAKIVDRETNMVANIYVLDQGHIRFGTHIHRTVGRATDVASRDTQSITVFLTLN